MYNLDAIKSKDINVKEWLLVAININFKAHETHPISLYDKCIDIFNFSFELHNAQCLYMLKYMLNKYLCNAHMLVSFIFIIDRQLVV